MTSFEFDEKRATKPKFVGQSTTALYFSQHLSSTRNRFFFAGQDDEMGNIGENLQRNNVARQFEGFCISYFAALKHEVNGGD